MILRVDTYRDSYRASLYSPFWIVNSTDLKAEFKVRIVRVEENYLLVLLQIDNESIIVDAVEHPFFICPRNFDSKAQKKKVYQSNFSNRQTRLIFQGYIRVYSIDQDDSISEWSEGFSLHVIKRIGITNCKVLHDRIYMINKSNGLRSMHG